MLKTIFYRIPFMRRYKKKQEEKRIRKIHESLYELKDSFTTAVNFDEVFKEFERILLELSESCSNDFYVTPTTKVSFFTKSSRSALDLVDAKAYGYETIARSGSQISVDKRTVDFIYWDSGKETNFLLYSLIKEMIIKANILRTEIDNDRVSTHNVSVEEESFINSILFRYLCSDIIELLIVYLEDRHAIKTVK